MGKHKVEEYYKDEENKKQKRYRVKEVPSYFGIGSHKLEDGSEYIFDDEYTVKATENTAKLEEINEIRPAHIDHWNFHRNDNRSPDFDCKNFSFMDKFHIKKDKKGKPVTYHDLFDLTWTDLNKLPMLGGRSMQILNPDTKKFDSLAFQTSIPPAAKGLGRIELDLSEVEPPEDEEDKTISFIDTEGFETPHYISKFSEVEDIKFASVLFKEDNMPEDEEELFADEDEEELFADEDEEEGGADVEPTGGEPAPEPKPEVQPEDEALAAYLADDLDDKLDEKFEAFGIQMMQQIEMLMLKMQPAGAPAAPATPQVQAPTQAVGFDEKAIKVYSAHFSEAQEKVDNRERVTIGANGEEVWDNAKPKLIDAHKVYQEIIKFQHEGKHAEAAAKFSEIDVIIKRATKSLPPHIRPPKLGSIDKKLMKALYAEELPQELRGLPKVGQAFDEFNEGKEYESTDGAQRRNAALLSEYKHGARHKLECFSEYYNRIFAPTEGITERIKFSVIKEIIEKEQANKKVGG